MPNGKFGAGNIIFIGRNTKARYSEAMQLQAVDSPIKRIFTHTGYRVVDGERVFLNDGYSVTKDGLTDKYNVALGKQMECYKFFGEQEQERFYTLLTLLPAVAPQALVYALLGYSFLTPLNALLRENAVEPRFILYIVGKTGSFKTTMALLALNFFGSYPRGGYAPSNFMDTENAAGMKFALTDSTLVLLDDRIPNASAKVKSRMEALEQSVARMIGDRAGRGRMNANSTLQDVYRPKCNLLLTAEEAYTNTGESAVARSLSVELKHGDIDTEALTAVQKNARHLNQCMSGYIQYIINNWDRLAETLDSKFTTLSKKAQTGGHGRMAESVAHLQIGISTMCEWLLSENQISKEQSEQMQSVAWSEFMKLAENQNKRIVEEKPVKLFLDAVREMKDQNAIRIADWDKRNDWPSSTTVGYKDTDFYYFYPSEIYSQVRQFYEKQDKNFPLSKQALFRQLEIDGLIEVDKGQNTKTKLVDAKSGKRPRFLWLRVSALDAQQEQEV